MQTWPVFTLQQVTSSLHIHIHIISYLLVIDLFISGNASWPPHLSHVTVVPNWTVLGVAHIPTSTSISHTTRVLATLANRKDLF